MLYGHLPARAGFFLSVFDIFLPRADSEVAVQINSFKSDFSVTRRTGGSFLWATQMVNYRLISLALTALMDRLVHNGHRVELRGESMHKLAQTDQTS